MSYVIHFLPKLVENAEEKPLTNLGGTIDFLERVEIGF